MAIGGVGEGAGEDRKGPLDHDPPLTLVKEMGGSRVGQEEGWTAVELWEHLGQAVFKSKSPGWWVLCLVGISLHFMVTVRDQPTGRRLWSVLVDSEGQRLEPLGNFASHTRRPGEHVFMATTIMIQRSLGRLRAFLLSVRVFLPFLCFLLFSPHWLLLLFHATHKAGNTPQLPGFHWMGPDSQKKAPLLCVSIPHFMEREANWPNLDHSHPWNNQLCPERARPY